LFHPNSNIIFAVELDVVVEIEPPRRHGSINMVLMPWTVTELLADSLLRNWTI